MSPKNHFILNLGLLQMICFAFSTAPALSRTPLTGLDLVGLRDVTITLLPETPFIGSRPNPLADAQCQDNGDETVTVTDAFGKKHDYGTPEGNCDYYAGASTPDPFVYYACGPDNQPVIKRRACPKGQRCEWEEQGAGEPLAHCKRPTEDFCYDDGIEVHFREYGAELTIPEDTCSLDGTSILRTSCMNKKKVHTTVDSCPENTACTVSFDADGKSVATCQ